MKTTEQKVPTLRFPEFEGEWEEKKLGELAQLGSSKRVYISDYVENGIPFYRGKEITELKSNKQTSEILYISQELYDKFKVSYGVPKEGDILITAVGTLGNIWLVDDHKFYFKDGNLIWISNIQISNHFLAVLLERDKKEIEKTAIGSSQKALTMVELNKLQLSFPSLPEQQKIADFLSATDKRLELLKEKKQGLEDYKRGAMQRIFSQELRFTRADGSAYPDWEEKKLGEIFRITRGQVLAVNRMKKIANKDAIYPVYSSQTKENGLTGYYDEYLFSDAITWTTDGANAGDVKYRKGKFYCTNVCGVMLSDVGYANQCIAEIFNSVSKRYVSYVGNPKLMNNVVETIKLIIPSSLSEQTQIANFLSAIDVKIEKLGEQIEATENYKKGLLQQMFV